MGWSWLNLAPAHETHYKLFPNSSFFTSSDGTVGAISSKPTSIRELSAIGQGRSVVPSSQPPGNLSLPSLSSEQSSSFNLRLKDRTDTHTHPTKMSRGLQDTVDTFRLMMEEMQKKVSAVRERMDEVYKKIQQLEAQRHSLVTTNDQLNKELHQLSSQLAIFEKQKNLDPIEAGKKERLPVQR